MQPTVLGFSLRSIEDAPASILVERIERALRIPLREGEYQRLPAHVATVFGMSIALFPWGGPDGTMLFILEGEVADADFVTSLDDTQAVERLDISDAVAYALEVGGAGNWHRPTPEELAAHTRYSQAHEE